MTLAILLLFGLQSNQAQDSKPEVIEAGALTCEVHVSRTAHLFHVVDQLAEWSPYCHRQYGRHFRGADGNGLSEEDRILLARHTAVRGQRGWGAGLEQTFYSPLDLDAAIKAGIEAGHLTAEQGKVEAEVFRHFAPRIDRLLAGDRRRLQKYAEKLRERRAQLAEFSDRVSRLLGGARVNVPVYLIANPSDSDIGGGFNGGRLTLEIPTNRDAFPSLLHEIFHAFLEPRRGDLEKAVAGVKGLDTMTLNEGLAYALSPGLFHTGGGDPLFDKVKDDEARGGTLTDDYVRFNRLGLAIRPFLRDALERDGETFERLLARAVDAWRVLAELGATPAGRAAKPVHNYRLDRRPCVFIFGGSSETLSNRFYALGDRHVFGRNHGPKEYDEMFKNHNKPGDVVVLLLDLSSSERVPEAYQDFLPKPWAEIEAALKKGESLELEGEARRMRTLLLAAPDRAGLERLMKGTKGVR